MFQMAWRGATPPSTPRHLAELPVAKVTNKTESTKKKPRKECFGGYFELFFAKNCKLIFVHSLMRVT